MTMHKLTNALSLSLTHTHTYKVKSNHFTGLEAKNKKQKTTQQVGPDTK